MRKPTQKYVFSLLNADYVRLDRHWNYPNIISPYYRMYYIDDGKGVISGVSGNVTLEPGFIYLIPSFTFCGLSCPDFLSQYFIQFFEEATDGISLFARNRSVIKVAATADDLRQFQRLITINPGRGINRSDDPKIYERNIFYKEYQELNDRQHLPDFLETQGIILQLLSHFLASDSFTQHQVSAIPVKVLDTISFIALHLHEKLTVASLAARANQNSEYFSRCFERYTGERPLHYLNGKRVERAQYLIVTSQLNLARIAEQTGFENQAHFSKVFKKYTGVAPRNYKS